MENLEQQVHAAHVKVVLDVIRVEHPKGLSYDDMAERIVRALEKADGFA